MCKQIINNNSIPNLPLLPVVEVIYIILEK